MVDLHRQDSGMHFPPMDQKNSLFLWTFWKLLAKYWFGNAFKRIDVHLDLSKLDVCYIGKTLPTCIE